MEEIRRRFEGRAAFATRAEWEAVRVELLGRKGGVIRTLLESIAQVPPAERKALSYMTWVKVMAHGGKQAFVVNPESCHACGLCVRACPEKAIRLIRFEQETAP